MSNRAQVGVGTRVGDFSVVYDQVELGRNVTVESHCVLGLPTPLSNGEPLVVADNSIIRSHSILYEGSRFGSALQTGHHVTIREGVDAGVSLQIGSYSDVQGDLIIGDHVRTQSNVFIGKHTTIGNYVWLFPHAILTNDRQPPSEGPYIGPTIEDFVVIGASSTILAGVHIAHHAVVAAQSFVNVDVAEYDLVGGVPARRLKDSRDVLLDDGSGRAAYPWTSHFHRGYPPEDVAQWMSAQPPTGEP